MRKRKFDWVLLSGPIVTLGFSTNFTYDPFHNVKLILLGFFAGIAIAGVISRIKGYGVQPYKIQLAIGLAFLLGLINPMLFANSPLSQQIYGVSGRSLGFLHYFFLLCILLWASVSNAEILTRNFLKIVVVTGIAESLYGVIQYLGIDPIQWENDSDWIFGTFGNPNFLSAFIGMSVCVSGFLFFSNLGLMWRIINGINICLGILCIAISSSIQGLMLVVIGIFSLTLFYGFSKSRLWGLIILITGSISGIISVLALLQKGPLAPLLYQDSTTFRGDYWRAGVKMAREHLFTGVGLDSYVDYYRQYRDITAANRRGLDMYSDNAHNLLIDLAANGGLFLVITYLLIIIVVSYSVIQYYRATSHRKLEDFALPMLWIVFQVQTLVSINVSSVAIWGWIAGGLLISRNSINKLGFEEKGLKGQKFSRGKYKFKFSPIVLPLVFATMVTPILVKDVELSRALSGQSGPRLQEVVSSWPRSCFLMAKAEGAYSYLGDSGTSLAISLLSVQSNDRCFNSYRNISENLISNESQQKLAIKKMRELDPLFK